jgi:hypothetical protein
MTQNTRLPTILLLLFPFACMAQAEAAAPFAIRVVDDQTGRGVPLVELETVNHLLFVTDSGGLVAFDEPGLMGREVFFAVRSHGYEFPKDGFGSVGVALRTEPGGQAELKIRRVNVAERLYRVTGQGIYRDTAALGRAAPLREPLLNAQVAGQDSALAAPYRGKLYWLWGDTLRPRYPLGNFQTAGAISGLPGQGGLDPAAGVDLKYFVDSDGFAKKMAPFKEPGMVWLDGVLTVLDPAKRERLVAHYSRMKSLGERTEHGLVMFNDQKEEFEKVVAFDLKDAWRCPVGHPVRVSEDGTERFYFPAPFCTVRVPATLADVRNQASYEAFTPGHEWRKDAAPLTQKAEHLLIAAGKLKPEDAWLQPVDEETGAVVHMHGGSVCWNEFRKKWILIAVQDGGTSSYLGEVWYSEAERVTGPWRRARKIVTHDRYSFYNPVQHPFFDQDGGRLIYFEGTYASTFSGNPLPTPRYDYNQVMYRLDLADPRLRLTQ